MADHDVDYNPFRRRPPAPIRVPRGANEPARKITVEFTRDYPPTGKRRFDRVTMPQGAGLILISSGYAKEILE